MHADVGVSRCLAKNVGPFQVPEAAATRPMAKRTPDLAKFRVNVWAN